MDEEFTLHWKSYVFQSLLATLTIFVALLVFTMQHPVIIASIGATALMCSRGRTALRRNRGMLWEGIWWAFFAVLCVR